MTGVLQYLNLSERKKKREAGVEQLTLLSLVAAARVQNRVRSDLRRGSGQQ